MKRIPPIAIAIFTAMLLFVAAAGAALVRSGNLILVADGGFTPRQLPRNSFAPIDFKGHANLKAVDGGIPAALQQAVIDFDRDGKLTTAGLATCDPSLLADRTPDEARKVCASAIVGRGRVGALISQEGGGPIAAASPLTVFNGPRQAGKPTAILHARTTVPVAQTFVIAVPIEKRRGEFRYRAIVDVPPIAAGRGSLTELKVEIGRRYRVAGNRRSYVAARCSDNVLRTRGRFTFADGMIVDGSVDKSCTVAR